FEVLVEALQSEMDSLSHVLVDGERYVRGAPEGERLDLLDRDPPCRSQDLLLGRSQILVILPGRQRHRGAVGEHHRGGDSRREDELVAEREVIRAQTAT